MKNFFRQVFFWDNPAAGAVFGWLLSAVFGYTFANMICLSENIFTALRGNNYDGRTAWLLFALAVVIVQVLLLLYCVILNWRFFYRQDDRRGKWGFWLIILLYIAAFILCESFFDTRIFILVSGVIAAAGFNALCIRKNNLWWYAAALLSWLFCLAGATMLFTVSTYLDFFDCYPAEKGLIPLPLRIPLAYSFVVFLAISAWCSFKLWASAENKRLRDVWGAGCYGVIFLLVFGYIATVAAALYQDEQSRKEFAALEANFQRKVNVEAIKKYYYQDRKVDVKFHEELKKTLDEFTGSYNDFSQIIANTSLQEIPPEYRSRFFSSQAEKSGKFFDAPLPACKRDYYPGNLLAIMLPELRQMREAARIFCWQMRIASSEKNPAQAMLAWQRSKRISEFLERDTSLIAALVFIAVEQIRLNGLEYMLSAGFLSDKELLVIQEDLKKSAAPMPELNRNCLYFESVMGTDTLLGMADGTISSKDGKKTFEGLSGYRFLAPGLWYLGSCNYCEILKIYNRKNLCHTEEKILMSPKKLFAAMLIPALSTAGQKMHQMEMRYLAFAALIEAEKIKRISGKYPEKLPLTVKDYFSGKPLQYKIGSHEIYVNKLVERQKPAAGEGDIFLECDDKRKYEVDSGTRQTVHGVAVWSVGRNKVDDSGFDGSRQVDGKSVRCDDVRALLVIR